MIRVPVLAVMAYVAVGTATAQDVSVPAVTVANPGGYANPLKLDTDRYDRNRKARAVAPSSTRCSADALPAAERRVMEAEYARRFRREGKASADRWAAEKGRAFRARLVAQGICPPRPGSTRVADADRTPRAKGGTRGRKGGKCTKTVMQARNIANPGGGAMSMIMVPVCVN